MSAKFVVAIGYSEGGLEPLLTFFDHVPHDQATYIVLRHIPIDQRSVLVDILKRHSKLEICEAVDGMLIDNDKIYIPPSACYITINNDKLYLHPRVQESRNYNFAVNIFLQSLAAAKSAKSIAVILSGNGFDGALGVTQIHEAGGVVIAQTPASCSHPGMPQNAIDTNCVHQVLPPSEMPAYITKHVHAVLKNANEATRFNERTGPQ